MQRYSDIDRDSGVEAYEIEPDSITVRFKAGRFRNYLYNYASTGASDVEKMKRLAAAGDGLNVFIKLHVGKRFARKW